MTLSFWELRGGVGPGPPPNVKTPLLKTLAWIVRSVVFLKNQEAWGYHRGSTENILFLSRLLRSLFYAEFVGFNDNAFERKDYWVYLPIILLFEHCKSCFVSNF